MLFNHNYKVLIVDDDPENIRVLMGILEEEYAVIAATNGNKAIELAAKVPHPDIILLDILLPDLDGYEVCSRLKANQETKDIPIIFITALGEITNEAKGFEVGAVDYIIKPVSPSIVRARIKNHLTVQRLYRELQNANSVLEERVRERTAQLQQMIFYDSLTQLPSRNALLQRIEEAIVQTKKRSGYGFALLTLDLHRFSLVNSSLGHEIGDRLLQKIGRHLKTFITPRDIVARMGSNTFGLFLDNVINVGEVGGLAEQILQSFSDSFWVEGYEIFLGASIGIALSGSESQTPLDLFRDADTALQKAKSKGRGHYHVFDINMREAAKERLELEMDLRRAIQNEQFLVYYQPIVDLKTGRVRSFEALARWKHPTRGMVSPEKFIPCLEETGLITSLGLWLLEQACYQLGLWQEKFQESLDISVNLSPWQFSHPNLLQDIESIIIKTGINPLNLQLEVTESSIIEDIHKAISVIQTLRNKNISICLDDFGTGYSSLSYLHKLPVDVLKIDRSFIKDMEINQENNELVKLIILLGHTLKMKVIAEGCENTNQLSLLRDWGCEYAQGHFFSKALSQKDATELLLQIGSNDL